MRLPKLRIFSFDQGSYVGTPTHFDRIIPLFQRIPDRFTYLNKERPNLQGENVRINIPIAVILSFPSRTMTE